MLSSICFMPASLTPQSLPPGSPTMAMYLSFSTVVTCMRAGLYQTKNGVVGFLCSVRWGTRRRQANRRLRIHRARYLRDARDRRVHAWRSDRLLGRGLVDVGEAHALH